MLPRKGSPYRTRYQCLCVPKTSTNVFYHRRRKKKNNSASGDIVIYVNFIHLKLEKDIN